MHIEALLKLKCQQALAQGDYDSLSSYSQQLVMFQQGTPIGEMPLGEELESLWQVYRGYVHGEVTWEVLELNFNQAYGEDLTKVCLDFAKTYDYKYLPK